MGSNTILLLVGGGHSAGKKTICDVISNTISPKTPVKIIEFDKYLKSNTNTYGPDDYDFRKLIKDVNEPHQGRLAIIVHGLYALYNKELRDQASMKVFVDCDPDVRLNRMVSQEVLHGSKQLSDVLDLYLKELRSEFNQFISPTKDKADVILPSEHPETGVKLICDGLQGMIKGESAQSGIDALYPRESLANIQSEGNFDKSRFYELS